MIRSRNLVLSLLKDFRVVTDSDAWQYVDVDVPELEGLLLHAEALELVYVVNDAADNDLLWNFEVYYGYSRNREVATPALLVASDIATVAPARVASGITAEKFQSHARVRLRYKRGTASGVRKGLITADLLVKTVGQ